MSQASMPAAFSLAGRTALATGGGSVLGLAMARELAEADPASVRAGVAAVLLAGQALYVDGGFTASM